MSARLHPGPGSGPAVPDGTWTAEIASIRVLFGEGVLGALGAEAHRLGAKRILLVTDPGLEAAGHARRALASLGEAGLDVTVFDDVEENPTTEHVGAGLAAARQASPDLLVALGGGSAMDCAKGINFLSSNGGQMEDYWGSGKAERPMLPSIGVPTTAGTGSEAQSYALISQAETHVKMACGDRKARFRTVLLDPSLLVSVPREVAATTGFDAVSHAVESYVTRRRTPISQLYAREAWRLLERSLEPFLAHPSDAAARRDMLLGAHLGGAAIEQSMLGAAHSCANPLTARYGVTHGRAVGLMLPHVVRFNGGAGEEVDGWYGELLAASGAAASTNGAGHAAHLGRRLDALRSAAGLAARLEEVGVDAAALGELAEAAAREWTAHFNPRPVTAADLRGIYERAL